MHRAIFTLTFNTLACCFVAMMLQSGLIGCKRRQHARVYVPPVQEAYDTRPLDARGLVGDAQLQKRVLNMPTGEMMARLGAMALSCRSTLTIQAANEPPLFEHTQTAELRQDSAAHVHLKQVGNERRLELLVFDDKAFVRLDRGHLRIKAPRDMEVAEILEAAGSGLGQALAPFSPLKLEGPLPAGAPRADGRKVARYRLGLDVETSQVTGNANSFVAQDLLEPLAQGPGAQKVKGALPLAAPPLWRQNASQKVLQGEIDVDETTGTVLRAELGGHLMIARPHLPPAALGVRYSHTIGDVGRVATIAMPQSSVSEYKRPIRNRDPLNFERSTKNDAP